MTRFVLSVVPPLRFLLIGLLALTTFAQQPAGTGQLVQLPYVFPDESGSQWDVQFDGSIGDGGNDLYDGGGRLFINNMAQYQSPTQQAVLDPARHELNFPPMQLAGLNVSRRVAVLPSLSTVRFTEILENPTAAPIKAQLRCYFNMGQSLVNAVPLVDEKKTRSQPCGFALADPNNAVAMIACGRGAKLQPRFNYRMNDDNVDIFYDVEVPARQTVVIVHLQLRRRTADQAADDWKELRERDLLSDLPRELRKRVVNFPGGDPLVGDLEILRGDALDVVELRGGDAYRGTLKIDRFCLQTLYGPLILPANKVVAMLNVGTFKPSQLLVTNDGEIFGGRLDVDSLPLEMTGGQLTRIPLSQITRLGYRHRVGDVDEWNFENTPTAYLRSGERIRIDRPPGDFNLATPSGPVRLNPGVIASIVFQGEDNNVPEVHLVDGTRLSALLGASAFEMALPGLGGPQQPQRARFPAAALLRFNFAPEREPDFLTPTFTLANQDTLVGTIGGTLSLETPFDTIHVEGDQIKALAHTRAGGDHDVQVTLWDDSTLSGRLVESHLTCLLKCGVSLRVPIALIARYEQPLPLPSPPMVARIRHIAHQLDSDDWRVRDAAQTQILAIGPSVMSVLRQMQPTAPTEAAQRMELIVSRLSRQLERGAAAGAKGVGTVDFEGDAPVPPGAGIPVFR
ncbi:MAG TPA: hypothetical protein VH475_09450 [Tepidisphaeraceae bacterium]|jgi:hypothetical protein